MLKIKKSKGVLAKDGKTPWAAGTLHATSAGWKCPFAYKMKTLAYVMAGLVNGEFTEVELIDEDNNQFVISKDMRFKQWKELK